MEFERLPPRIKTERGSHGENEILDTSNLIACYGEAFSTIDKKRLPFLLAIRADAIKVQPVADEFIARFGGKLCSHFGKAQ